MHVLANLLSTCTACSDHPAHGAFGLGPKLQRLHDPAMDLYLRKVIHPQAADNYRVILKDDDATEIEIGSIGVQFDGWAWGIDTAIPMKEIEAQGTGKDRADCMRQFRAAWDRLSSDPCSTDRISRSEAEAAAMSRSRRWDTVEAVRQ